MRELSSPQALLQKHLDENPEVVIVASIARGGKHVMYDASAPAPMSDLFFLLKLIEHKLNHSLDMSMKAAWEEEKKAQVTEQWGG
jgi:hypothetical protein